MGNCLLKVDYKSKSNISQTFSYTGNVQTYIVPISGIYKLECYGGAGGDVRGANNRYGKGGYTCGNVKLSKGTILYICCGGKGTDAPSDSYGGRPGVDISGGYNGGGTGRFFKDQDDYVYGYGWYGGGGGATHIAKVDGTLSSIGKTSFDTDGLIVAAGGGGGGCFGDNGTDYWYTGGTANNQSAKGSFGQGGNGGRGGKGYYGGPGGGGGYAGGSCPGNGRKVKGAGGAGSGWTHSSLTSTSIETGSNTGAGYAVITLVEGPTIKRMMLASNI